MVRSNMDSQSYITNENIDSESKIRHEKKRFLYPCSLSPFLEEGPTLLQRLITEGQFSADEIRTFLSLYPELVFMETKDPKYPRTIFHTALDLYNSNLLAVLLMSIFDSKCINGLSNVNYIMEIVESCISLYPEVWMKIVKDMCFVPSKYYATSENRLKKEGVSARLLSTPSMFSIPWQQCNEKGGDVLFAVTPMPGLGSYRLLSRMVKHCSVSMMDTDVMDAVIEVLWRDHIQWYFLLELGLFLILICVRWCAVKCTDQFFHKLALLI